MAKHIVFLGSNPAESAGTVVPFANCKAGIELKKWITILELEESDYVLNNVSHEPTLKNRPLSSKEINENLYRLAIETRGCLVICLGATAKKAMERVQLWRLKNRPDWDDYHGPIEMVFLNHPSGKNRANNDKVALAMMLELAKGEIAQFNAYMKKWNFHP